MSVNEIIVIAMFTVAAVVLTGVNGLVLGAVGLIVLAHLGGMPVAGVVGGIGAAVLVSFFMVRRYRRGLPDSRFAKES